MSTPNSLRHEKRHKHVQSRFNLSGDAWADIVNKQPLNSAFLFKVTHETFPKNIFVKSDYFRFLCFYETRTTLWRTSSSIVWNSLGSSGLGSAQLTLHNFRESALNNEPLFHLHYMWAHSIALSLFRWPEQLILSRMNRWVFLFESHAMLAHQTNRSRFYYPKSVRKMRH